MSVFYRVFPVVFAALGLTVNGTAQADDICREAGAFPSLNLPSAQVPYVYGRVILKGFTDLLKHPKVTIMLVDPQQSDKRITVGPSGNYCFRRTAASGGTLIVEIEGAEVARKTISSFGAAQQREDFEVHSAPSDRAPSPGTVSAKFSYPQNEKTIELYKRAAEFERNKDIGQAIGYLKDVVRIDPNDFIAWAKLGTLYFEQGALKEAEGALRKSIESKLEYTPAWINMGKIRMAQKQYEGAIEIFKHAAFLDPKSARAFQLLGEAYLQARQGTTGVAALREAIRLDPIGMAESHLLIARLYHLAGAKALAANEYKILLEKVPEHPEKKKLEAYIKVNPPASVQ
ncbi:MAG: tetratricopeptide repeat protein [Pyrinomonadaceae bacterium]